MLGRRTDPLPLRKLNFAFRASDATTQSSAMKTIKFIFAILAQFAESKLKKKRDQLLKSQADCSRDRSNQESGEMRIQT